MEELGDHVVSAAISPDGRRLLCGKYGGPLELWDLVTKEKLRTLHRRSDWYETAIAPDGKHGVPVLSEATRLRVWELETGKVVRTFTYRGQWRASTIAFSADGIRMVAGSEGCLQVWDLRTGEEMCHLGVEGNVYGAVLTGDGGYTMSICGNKVIVWNLERGLEVCDFQNDAPFTCCSCSRDGSLLMAGDSSGGVHTFRLHYG